MSDRGDSPERAGAMTWWRLRDLSCGARIGLTCLLVVLLGGLAASAVQIKDSFEMRDEEPGLSMTDLKGAYHGADVEAPMLTALRRGHPADLSADSRAVLVKWLESKRINEDYDNPKIDAAGIIAASCVSCHSRRSTKSPEIGQKLPLETLVDVSKVAFSKNIPATDWKLAVTSTHAHALGLGPMAIVLAGLVLATRWSRKAVGLVIGLTGFGLLADLSSWWLSRDYGPHWPGAMFVPVIVVAGGLFCAGVVVMILMAAADMWLPRKRA